MAYIRRAIQVLDKIPDKKRGMGAFQAQISIVGRD